VIVLSDTGSPFEATRQAPLELPAMTPLTLGHRWDDVCRDLIATGFPSGRLVPVAQRMERDGTPVAEPRRPKSNA
jgi:hypothetical protein